MPDLSIVTITKDSENTIEDLVRHALTIGDEHVVVDTGSTDQTVDRARRAGARVISYTGEFDFSSARNFGTQNTRYGWVLHLDTDEKIDAQSQPRIRQLIAGPFSMYKLLQCSRRPARFQLSYQDRLFRKGEHEFNGRVYECLWPQRDYSIAPLVLSHYKDPTLDNKKIEERYPLARREVDELREKMPLTKREAAYQLFRFAHLYGLFSATHNEDESERAIYEVLARVEQFPENDAIFNLQRIKALRLVDPTHLIIPEIASLTGISGADWCLLGQYFNFTSSQLAKEFHGRALTEEDNHIYRFHYGSALAQLGEK